jgi:hypothetical protein
VKKILILTSAAMLSLPAFAAAPATQQDSVRVLSTTELVGLCKQKNDAQAVSFCNGFGEGVYESYLVTRHPKKAPSNVCVKQPAPTRQQVVDEFVVWAEKNAQYNDKPAAEAALRFMAQRFPCGK